MGYTAPRHTCSLCLALIPDIELDLALQNHLVHDCMHRASGDKIRKQPKHHWDDDNLVLALHAALPYGVYAVSPMGFAVKLPRDFEFAYEAFYDEDQWEPP
jgi:hypothetical protein